MTTQDVPFLNTEPKHSISLLKYIYVWSFAKGPYSISSLSENDIDHNFLSYNKHTWVTVPNCTVLNQTAQWKWCKTHFVNVRNAKRWTSVNLENLSKRPVRKGLETVHEVETPNQTETTTNDKWQWIWQFHINWTSVSEYVSININAFRSNHSNPSYKSSSAFSVFAIDRFLSAQRLMHIYEREQASSAQEINELAWLPSSPWAWERQGKMPILLGRATGRLGSVQFISLTGWSQQNEKLQS